MDREKRERGRLRKEGILGFTLCNKGLLGTLGLLCSCRRDFEMPDDT